MAELTSPYICDVCGIQKRETNHWFRVWRAQDGIVLIAPWDTCHIIPYHIHAHCCGEEHALRKAGELLSKIGK